MEGRPVDPRPWWRRGWVAPLAGGLGLLVGLGVGALAAGDREPATRMLTATVSRTGTVTTTVTVRSRPQTVTVTRTAPEVSAYDRGPRSGCDRNYTGCVPTGGGRVECGDLVGPVRVIGRDVHGLDPDRDGVACERD
jgi:hypothetical protein